MARKKSEIDWTLVDSMLEAGCTGEEVAARIGCHADTLYKRIEETFKTGFTAYRQQKVAKGDQILREKLFTKATGGDTTSLIFLAKTRLGMSEKVEVEHTIPEQTAQTIVQIAFRSNEAKQS